MTRTCRVLVIDDNLTDLLLAQMALQQQVRSFTLTTASSGPEALQQLRCDNVNAPDLISLDIHMPGMDGFDVLQALQSDAALQAIPVLMFTTSAHADDVQRARALHADGYLLKSSSLETTAQQLFEVLDYWCRQQPK